mmetsp:Transcript_16506/g.28326  ORF Transcript_16506/g.28326 Transcript_16506/m.28326 type:complete len:155 (-) Transcript_16506:717-1181(-)
MILADTNNATHKVLDGFRTKGLVAWDGNPEKGTLISPYHTRHAQRGEDGSVSGDDDVHAVPVANGNCQSQYEDAPAEPSNFGMLSDWRPDRTELALDELKANAKSWVWIELRIGGNENIAHREENMPQEVTGIVPLCCHEPKQVLRRQRIRRRA